ncbi:hypothetical protein CesoFtcFv8_001541 [Champsocephalus esox]|uniref:Uncharacterized protein n=1 Tax=Champsocephalus esox TaxID=159716 RepID=A0AAN8HKY4_9TELE|nr:hypothetical protein CesoFtcFv8_001541 [Champsocephalus esox]
MQPPAEELEEKEWTILDNYNDISTDDELFYRADDLLITSTPDSILAPAPEEPTLPLTALEPTPPLTALEPILPLTALETTPPLTALEPTLPLIALEPTPPLTALEPTLILTALEPTPPLTALEPTLLLTALEPTLLLTALEPTLAQATAPDPTIAPAPEYLTLAPLTASEPAIAEATVQQPTLAPPPEPTHKPPIRQPCGPKCRRKCSEKCSEDRRRDIWGKYWDMPYPEKRSFMFHGVCQVPTAKVCGDGKPSRRGRSFIYRLKDEDQVPQQVCKLFFLSTLGYHPTNDSLVLSVMGKDISTPLAPPKDQRGRHAPANKLDQKPLHEHIESFHPSVSHYRREACPMAPLPPQ